MASLQDGNGDPYGFPWEAGAMIMSAARGDLLEQKGLGMPTTFDELLNVCEMTKGMERVAPFTADKLHHWNWIPGPAQPLPRVIDESHPPSESYPRHHGCSGCAHRKSASR